MDLDGLLIGAVTGFVIGGLIFTSTGRTVSRAAGERAAYHLRPKNGKKHRR